MTDTIEDLVKRLQESCPPNHDLSDPWPGALCAEAATALEAQAAEIKRLKVLLFMAAEDIADWGSYAGEYFQHKHDLEGDIQHYKDASK